MVNPEIWETWDGDQYQLEYQVTDDGTRVMLVDDLLYLGGDASARFAVLPPEHRPASQYVQSLNVGGEWINFFSTTAGVLHFWGGDNLTPGTIIPTAGITWLIH